MKHATAVAVLEGFFTAIAQAIKDGDLSHAGADKIMARSGSYSRKYLLGEEVQGQYLTDFQDDSDAYEAFHQAHPEATEIEKHD